MNHSKCAQHLNLFQCILQSHTMSFRLQPSVLQLGRNNYVFSSRLESSSHLSQAQRYNKSSSIQQLEGGSNVLQKLGTQSIAAEVNGFLPRIWRTNEMGEVSALRWNIAPK